MVISVAACTRTKEFPDKSVYKGDIKGGKLNGRGRMAYADGSVYEGEWQNDKKQGQGDMVYANGDKYTGAWADNSTNGRGVLISKNGDVYDGNWKEGRKSGNGVLTYANGDKYTGLWSEDRKNGQGGMFYKNGNKYTGLWKDDLNHGLGTMTYANGDTYTGEWERGERKGIKEFTKDRALEILSVSSETTEGEIFIEKSDQAGKVEIRIPGRIKIQVKKGKISPFCFRSIHIGPKLRIPADLFGENDYKDPSGHGYAVDHIEFNDLGLLKPIKADAQEYVVSGDAGLALTKEGKTFTLVGGSGYFQSYASDTAVAKSAPDRPAAGEAAAGKAGAEKAAQTLGLPKYSEVLSTYPVGTALCATVADVMGGDDKGLELSGNVAMMNGKFAWKYYGTKLTVKAAVTLGGKTYQPGNKLTVDKNLDWVAVSGWD